MGDSSKCSVTQEGENFVTAITAPGALIAYALIHLRSNNELAADKIEAPNSFYALEWVRPEHLMIRILCKNLILMDQVQGKKEWLYQQVPSLISFCFSKNISEVYAKYPEKDVDFSTIANCQVFALAGGFLSIAFKYLGTADTHVANLIIEEILNIREMKTQVIGQHELTDSNKNSIDKQTLLTTLCVGCLSLGLIMAGTGDANSFRLMKRIRKRVEGEYGFSVAVHMAIGFLFLGNCQYSFANSDFAIAAVLAAIYPKFPNSPSDNRHHLQAFRHLYILALEKRLLVTKDAEFNTLVHAPVKINYSDIGPVFATSPVLLRPLHLCISIESVGKEFFSFSCELKDLAKLVLFVKRVENQQEGSEWNWAKKAAEVSEEQLESWLGGCSSPDEYWKTLERVKKIYEKIKKKGTSDKGLGIIRKAYLENKQDIIPFLWGIKAKKMDLECVRLFYTKLLAAGKGNFLIGMENLYELYRE
jgi:anaphase-promoting complex subunit 1